MKPEDFNRKGPLFDLDLNKKASQADLVRNFTHLESCLQSGVESHALSSGL